MTYEQKLSEENWAYYVGDTFQFWTGPKPPINHPKYPQVMAQLKSVYHSYNVIREAIRHYRDALIGQPFNWYLKSADGGEVGKESATEKLLQSWWDWQKHLSISQALSQGKAIAEAVTQMLTRDSGEGIGTGYLRLYTPERYTNAKEPWKRIVLHCPRSGSVSVERDDDGVLWQANYHYSKGKEVYTLLDNGLTQIASYKGDIEEVKVSNLGGRLPIFELRAPCLIGADAKQAQNALNKTLTMKGENVNMAGFLERVLLNAQMPGRWQEDPSAPGGERFIPEANAMEFGSNKIAFVQGLPLGDPRNPSGYTNPSISYREPVSVQTFGDSIDIDIACFYRSVGLGHLLSAGDGSLSGVSRETLKQDFTTRLEGYAEPIEAILGDVFSTVLLLLDQAEYTPVVELRLSAGKPLPEERKENREDYNAGLRSRTTAMGEAGIADPDAEWELVKREKEEDIKRISMPRFSSDAETPDPAQKQVNNQQQEAIDE